MLVIPELGEAEWPLDHRNILMECRAELLNPEYALYQHGKRNTKNLGCGGPMCMKAARDYGRELMRARTGATKEYNSSVQKYDEFLEAYIQYAIRYHAEMGFLPPKRRKLKERTVRRNHLIPLSTARMLHRRRARLAS